MQSIRKFIRPAYILIAILIIVGLAFVIAELDGIMLAIQKRVPSTNFSHYING
jgi:hypothetical protein